MTPFERKVADLHDEIERYKAQQLDPQKPLPPMAEDEIIQLCMDVALKMDKFPVMLRGAVMMMLASGDERTMRAVQHWLQTVKPCKPYGPQI